SKSLHARASVVWRGGAANVSAAVKRSRDGQSSRRLNAIRLSFPLRKSTLTSSSSGTALLRLRLELNLVTEAAASCCQLLPPATPPEIGVRYQRKGGSPSFEPAEPFLLPAFPGSHFVPTPPSMAGYGTGKSGRAGKRAVLPPPEAACDQNNLREASNYLKVKENRAAVSASLFFINSGL